MIIGVADEGYAGNAPCALRSIYTKIIASVISISFRKKCKMITPVTLLILYDICLKL